MKTRKKKAGKSPVRVQRMVRLSGKKLIAYRKSLHREMDMATGAMQDAAERLGDPKYPSAEHDLKKHAERYRDAGLAHFRTIAKASVEVIQPNTPSSATGGAKGNQ